MLLHSQRAFFWISTLSMCFLSRGKGEPMQEESRSTSQNVKMGFQYRFQKGEMQINHNRFLGYTKDEKKQLIIDTEGAKVVKRIYREYLEGGKPL